MNILSTISSNRLWNKYGERAALVAALLCLVWVLGSIGWTVWHQTKIKQTNYQAQELRPVNNSSKPSYRVSDIVAANLFGDPTPAPVVKQAPKTTLNLTLQGILWASDDSMARAIIMSGNKKTELYSVGENIKGAGASIKEIRDGEVLLNRNGAIESLALVKKTDSGNRQLITYDDPFASASDQSPTASVPRRNQARVGEDRIARNSNNRARSPNGKPGKIRRPNFSGLDRALKKIGEL